MLFFGVAAYYPILGKYYKELGFSGTQIGILFSAATFITMLVQPLWGAICKKLGNCKSSFIVIHIAIIFIALFLPFIKLLASFNSHVHTFHISMWFISFVGHYDL